MTDEPAPSTGSSGTPPGPHAETPPSGGPAPGIPPGGPAQSTPPGGPGPGTPPGGPGTGTPPGAGGPGRGTPPPGSAAFAARYGLVRPLDGRYLGGVCAAIGRATGTDPVVWRVLLGVLTVFGGIGLLVYLLVLLATPAEGDTAAPVEAMFGRGRSSMSPLTVVALGAITVIGFGIIVNDSFRAMLLGAAILVGGALLLSRSGGDARIGRPGAGTPWPGAAPGHPSGPPPQYGPPQQYGPAQQYGPPQPYGPTPYPAAGRQYGPDAPAGQPSGPVPHAAEEQPYGPVPHAAEEQPYGPVPHAAEEQPYGPAEPRTYPDPGQAAAPQPDTTPAAEGEQPAERGTAADHDAAGDAPETPVDDDPARQLPAAGRLPEIGAGPTMAAFPAIPAPAPWPDRDEVTAVLPAGPAAPGAMAAEGTGEPGGPGRGPRSAFDLPPHTGYRPPFAPHGPYAGGAPPPLPPLPPPRQPKPSSPLGAATFWMIFVVLGVAAALELTGAVDVSPAGYFAAVLATIGLGLLIGTWFGRARWLIALGLAAAVALGVAGTTESWVPFTEKPRNVTWAPADYTALAPRYESNVGDAVLDLRAVDFTGRDTGITVVVGAGNVRVYLPEQVDVTATADVNVGDATLFGDRWSGVSGTRRERTDLGRDGAGGGTLRLDVRLNVGTLEVTR